MAYVRFRELDQKVVKLLQSPQAFGFTHKTDLIEMASAELGKVPFRGFDPLIDKYLTEHRDHQFVLTRDRVPTAFTGFVTLYIPEEQCPLWLEDKEAFHGQSPREHFSSLVGIILKARLDDFLDSMDELFRLVTLPPTPSREEIYYLFRLAQAEQLGLMDSVEGSKLSQKD